MSNGRVTGRGATRSVRGTLVLIGGVNRNRCTLQNAWRDSERPRPKCTPQVMLTP